MQSVAQAEAARTIEMDAALFTAARRAKQAYPAETCRIERGLAIAIEGGVTLFADGSAWVASQSQPGGHYTVNGHCTCKDATVAPHGRCKHRWGKALARWAQSYVAAQPHERYYATYTAPDGQAHQGVAEWTVKGWLFVADDGLDPLYAAIQALALGGNVAIAEAQAQADGDLVRKVCTHNGATYR